MNRTIWISGGVGLVVGIILTWVSFVQAALGHGSYVLWGVVSLPSLVLGMGHGEAIAIPLMLGIPCVQWMLLGVCVGKVLSGRSWWSFGVTCVGVTYVVCFLFGGARLSECIGPDTARAGLVAGLLLIVGSFLILAVKRKN
jgi:hypothetical protein